ncbi:MAG: transporter [Paracoccus sp. (in: a-proteobacteria)]|uniref:SphA family protein n=1 Tax=Paracoccus sp. TaxID=267 RepID=UPI0039E44F0B
MLKGKSGFRSMAGAMLLAAGLMSGPAQSAETIAAAGPIGGSDINSALLPPEGLWITGLGLGVGFSDYYDDKGDEMAAGGSDKLAGVGLLYSYPGQFMGGQLASSLFVGYERLCFNVKPYAKNCSSGAKDIYSDVLMWSRYFPNAHAMNQPQDAVPQPYGLGVLVGLGVTAPTGSYDKDKPINNGSNIWGFSPNIALTYTMPSPLPEVFGEAMQFSGRLFYHKYSENKDTKFQTGDVISLDWAITMGKGSWRYGLAGLAYKQLEDDTIDGVVHPNNGNRSSVFGLGPIVSRDFMWGERPANITIKGIQSVYGNNVAKSTGLLARVSVKF